MKHPLLPDNPLLSLGAGPSLPALPARFRLCVWNCHKGKHAQWKNDFLNLCAQNDLFLAQEIRLDAPAAQTLEQSGLNWNAAVSFLSPRGKIPTGIAAGCRTPAQHILFNAEIREPLIRTPKLTMRLVYPLAGTRLLVINLHAVNFTGLVLFEQTLRNAAHMLKNFEGPALVAGDFNVWSKKRTDALYRTAENLGLREVLFQPDKRTRYLRRPVDYIFTRGLRAVCACAAELDSSDHRPLCATLQLQ